MSYVDAGCCMMILAVPMSSSVQRVKGSSAERLREGPFLMIARSSGRHRRINKSRTTLAIIKVTMTPEFKHE